MPRPSFEFLTNHSAELPCLGRREITLLRLRIGVDHIEGLVARCPIVDDPQAAALPSTGCRPPDLAQAARALDDGPLFRPQNQGDLKLPIPFVLVEMPAERSGKHRSL